MVGGYGALGAQGAISAQRATTHPPNIRGVCASGDSVYWVQQPAGADTSQLVCYRNGRQQPVSPDHHDVRSTYGGYGGGDFSVQHGWVVYATPTGGVWSCSPNGVLSAIVTDNPHWGHAGFVLDLTRRVVFALRQDTRGTKTQPQVVRLPLAGELDQTCAPKNAVQSGSSTRPDIAEVVLSGAAGYTDIAVSPGGGRIAWVQIHQGLGAWGGTSLWVAHLTAQGTISEPHQIVGGAGVTVQQPMWLSTDQLVFITDDSGFGDVAVHELGSGTTRLLTESSVEYGHPRVTPGTSSYTRLSADLLVSTYSDNGFRKMRTIALNTGTTQEVVSPFVWVQRVVSSRGKLVAAGTRLDGASAVMQRTGPGTWEMLVQTGNYDDVIGSVPVPLAVSWQGPAGAVHGFYYGPSAPGDGGTEQEDSKTTPTWHDAVWNEATIDTVADQDDSVCVVRPGTENYRGQAMEHRYAGSNENAPPLIVTAHSGPVGCAIPSASLERAFWTSRGFGVLEVNPSGTQGFGRAYRDRLIGKWGQLDAAEVALGAQHIADLGWADPQQLVIRARGREALTALAAVSDHQVFAAASVVGGVLDVEVLRRRGSALDSEQVALLTRQATADGAGSVPSWAVCDVTVPVLFVHGAMDQVTPLTEVLAVCSAMRQRGAAAEVGVLDDAGHVMVAARHRRAALDAESDFYRRVLPGDGCGLCSGDAAAVGGQRGQ